ncbi:MAG TPA: ABC transporter permease [Solirubrobacteraceae bacterium]|nr:ABC transporter permease [Solirubrobacteraceae bacterium]
MSVISASPLRTARRHWTDGTVVAAAVLVVMLIVYAFFALLFSSFTIQALSNDTAPLALAAVGETLVVLTGGFDLSVGAIIGLVNVLLATHLTGHGGHDVMWVVLTVLIAAACGLLNGVLVAYIRLQSIIVTIATLFIFSGIALDVLPQPGGSVPLSFTNLLTGVTIIPRGLILILLAALAWLALRRTRLGAALYSIGGDREAARMSGIPIARRLLVTYTLAGLFYGLAGVFYTAQTGSGDPGTATSFLLAPFIAVVLGGTRFGGGEGSAIGSIVGAFIVTMLVAVIFVLGINTFSTGLVEGIVLALAVLLTTTVRRWRPRRET